MNDRGSSELRQVDEDLPIKTLRSRWAVLGNSVIGAVESPQELMHEVRQEPHQTPQVNKQFHSGIHVAPNRLLSPDGRGLVQTVHCATSDLPPPCVGLSVLSPTYHIPADSVIHRSDHQLVMTWPSNSRTHILLIWPSTQ